MYADGSSVAVCGGFVNVPSYRNLYNMIVGRIRPRHSIIIPSECVRSTLSREPVLADAGRPSYRVGIRCRQNEYFPPLLSLAQPPAVRSTSSVAHSLTVSLSTFESFHENRIPCLAAYNNTTITIIMITIAFYIHILFTFNAVVG